ncbi:MAG: hypothetical protein PHO18_02770 [Synergistaceae bacterium]|nr:hypothetical protein [Synergistaceae bacterium]
MQKTATLLSFLLFFFFIADSAVAEGLKELKPTKTSQHRSVFTLPVYLVLPEGYSFVKTESGCVDKTKRVSFEASVIRLPYSDLQKEFNEENLKKASMGLKMKNEFIWNGSSAMLMKIFQKTASKMVGKWTLIVDRGEECWLINGIYPAQDQKRGEDVLAAIKSAYWENSENQSSMGIPLGSVDVHGTPLKLAALLEGTVVYTKDGILPTRKEDGSLFVVSSLSGTLVAVDKQHEYAKERFQMVEKGEKIKIISDKEVTIDGLSGFEIIGYAAGEQKKLIYQMMLFDSMNSHVMVGIARSGIQELENISLFHDTAGTFKRAR